MDSDRKCKICFKRLRRLNKTTDWDARLYHISCYKGIISDIYNYNTTAYEKYGHEKRINGVPISEIRRNPKHKFIVYFD